MPNKRKEPVLAAVVVLPFALGVSQLQAQSPLTLEGLSERISQLARAVSTLRSTSSTMSEVIAPENRIATVEARLAEPSPPPRRRKNISCSIRSRLHSPKCALFLPFRGLTIGANHSELAACDLGVGALDASHAIVVEDRRHGLYKRNVGRDKSRASKSTPRRNG